MIFHEFHNRNPTCPSLPASEGNIELWELLLKENGSHRHAKLIHDESPRFQIQQISQN